MDRNDHTKRMIDQFSDHRDRDDIWKALGLVFPTTAFLNMGYSRWYETHLLGSPQLRLVERVVTELESECADWTSQRLLDLGCGRGGAAIHLQQTYGVPVVGIDLVRDNLVTAVTQALREGRPPPFVIGDATRLPFDRDAFSTGIAIDSIVYMPYKKEVFAELARILVPGGVCVISDLLVSTENPISDRTLGRFCDAWDMPPLWTVDAYRTAIEAAGLHITKISDLTSQSVGRFRKWTTLFLGLVDGVFGQLFKQILTRLGLHPETIVSQVRAAHGALPALRHTLFTVTTVP